MGIWREAVALYGVPLPDEHDAASAAGYELLDSILAHHAGVSHASAGPYDRNTTYLVTDYHSAEAGEVETFEPFDAKGRAERDARLENACRELELDPAPAPAWYLIHSES